MLLEDISWRLSLEGGAVMNGTQMLIAMRSDPQLASLPVIVMSAARRQIAVPAGEDFPEFSAFLRKPFQLKPLMDAIIEAIGGRE